MSQSTRPNFAAVSESRDNNFDFLRFFFAVMVIFCHAFALSLKPEPIATLTRGQTSGGGIALTGFFLLSGFLITKSWLYTPNFPLFLSKRLRRIFPGFAVALLFCVFIVGPLSGVALVPYFRNPATYRFLLQGIGMGATGLPDVFSNTPTPNNVNGSLWTIRIEFLCYLMVAFFGITGLLRYKFAVPAVLVLCASLQALSISTVPHARLPYLVDGFLMQAPTFLIGMCFYLYKERIPRHFILNILSIVLIALGCVMGSFLSFVIPICGAYLLFDFSFNPRIRLQNFGRNGDFSYGIYLYAFPVQQLINRYLTGDFPAITRFFLALPPTFLLAWASWNWVEKQFLQSRARLNPESMPIAVAPQSPFPST